MRIKLHEHTSFKNRKFWNVFVVCFFVLLYSVPALLACLIFVEAKATLAGILTLLIPAFILVVFARFIYCMSKSYAEFDDENVRVVEFYFFNKKEKVIHHSCVKRKNREFAFDVPGRRIHIPRLFRDFVEFKYIVFYDDDGEFLFKILDTPEGNEWADRLMNKH